MEQSEFRRAFWERVEKTSAGCWLWRGRVQWDGYGEASVKGRRMQAHRVAWTIANERRIAPGLEICHKCDVRSCVNPAHLFEGTHSDNEIDKVSKGRKEDTRGEGNPNAKLRAADVLEIRAVALDPAVRFADLAARFKVKESTIRAVAAGRFWAALPACAPAPRRERKRTARGIVGGMIWCGHCKSDRPVADFAPSVAARGQGWCRACYASDAKRRKLS